MLSSTSQVSFIKPLPTGGSAWVFRDLWSISELPGTFQIYFDKKAMEASEEQYLLALVSAMNLSHLLETNFTATDLAEILEQVARELAFCLTLRCSFDDCNISIRLQITENRKLQNRMCFLTEQN